MPEFTAANFIALISQYGYWVLLPIAMIEGPITALFAGFLVQMGYFNFFIIYAIFILGDFVPDTVYYYIGRYGNKKELREKYEQRFSLLKHLKVLEKLWHGHTVKTMFFSKLAAGLSGPLLISAGLVKLDFKKFISSAVPVAALQYLVFLSVGYSLGESFESAKKYIESAEIFIALAGIVFIAVFFTVQRYAKNKFESLKNSEVNNLTMGK